MKAVLGSEAVCRAVAATVDKALGYPIKGRPVGPGQVIQIQDTWDGTGPTPLGWTKTHEDVLAENSADAAYPVSDDVHALVVSSGRISAAERLAFTSASAGRLDVDASNGGLRKPRVAATAEKDTR